MKQPADRALTRCLAEAAGTFALVFAGCGAIVVNGLSGGALGQVGVALAFGLVVAAMVYSVGNVSGAHLNPAVMSADFTHLWVYLVTPFAGALLARPACRMLPGAECCAWPPEQGDEGE